MPTPFDPTEIDAFLGDTEVTDEQREHVYREAQAIADMYPDPDDTDERMWALSAVVATLIGDWTLADLGAKLDRARHAEREASVTAQWAARTAVQELGVSENGAAKQAGLDRMTVRKILGK